MTAVGRWSLSRGPFKMKMRDNCTLQLITDMLNSSIGYSYLAYHIAR